MQAVFLRKYSNNHSTTDTEKLIAHKVEKVTGSFDAVQCFS